MKELIEHIIIRTQKDLPQDTFSSNSKINDKERILNAAREKRL